MFFFTLQSLNWALICLHEVTQEALWPCLIISLMFFLAKMMHASMTLRRSNDVRKFKH